jgi:hypothetical protein
MAASARWQCRSAASSAHRSTAPPPASTSALQGVAGVEFGNTASGTVDNLIQTYDIKTRFFDQVNLGYYLQDNFKVFAGHCYLAAIMRWRAAANTASR